MVSGVKRVVVSGAEVLWFQVTNMFWFQVSEVLWFQVWKFCTSRCRSVIVSSVRSIVCFLDVEVLGSVSRSNRCYSSKCTKTFGFTCLKFVVSGVEILCF